MIFCAPVGANEAIAREVGPALKPGAIVSDVGSVKSAVIAAIAPHLPDTVHLVPAHPVAGTEQSGPEAGFAALFVNRWCILTPPEGTSTEAVARLGRFWQALGSNIEVMSPSHHDLVLAITSHVPHLIAYNIVGTAADLEEVTRSEVIKFSAGGFRDFTRIAASDPTMWRDVFLHNKEAVLEMLGRFSEDLTALQRMIRRGDGDGLFELFTRTSSDPSRHRRTRPGNPGAGFRPSRRARCRRMSVEARSVPESDVRSSRRPVGLRLWFADLAPRIRFHRTPEGPGGGMAATFVHLFAPLPRDARPARTCARARRRRQLPGRRLSRRRQPSR